MSDDTGRAAEVVSLVEYYTDISIPEDPSSRDMFGRVLFQLGTKALEQEQQFGEPSSDLVATFLEISAAVVRVQDAEQHAN